MKKYMHPLSGTLTPDNWQEKLNLNALSLEDMIEVFGDMKSMESVSKKIGGFLKEVIKARMPEDEDEYDSPHFHIQRNFRSRAGGLDRERILETMGETWAEEFSHEPTEYVEIRCTKREEEE